ncbi:MAG: hypothetical protein RBS81_03585 [Tenuifilaceae bacterium]|jgi:hypothetical protein|nr:hypothetical protein [Tenuifilaceae bacterium]
MIKKIACLVVAVFALAPVFSQTYSTKFGKISDEELSMSVYPADSTASAVVLHDIGRSIIFYNTIDNKFQLRIKRQTRIKILNKEGFDWGNVEIPLYQGNGMKETIADIKAYTFNLVNGKQEKEKVNRKDIYYETVSESKRVCKFAMPKVIEGSVFEYEYEIVSDYIYNLQPWSFQFFIPVVYTEYNVFYPEYFTYNPHLSGYENIHVKNSSSMQKIVFTGFYRGGNGPSQAYSETLSYLQTEKTFTASNVPALKSEVYVDNISNYISRVSFELAQTKFPNEVAKQHTSTWAKIVEDFLDHSDFGGQLNGGNYLEDDLNAHLASVENSNERLVATYNFIKDRVKWNGKYRVFTDNGVRAAYKENIGTSAEVNLNLIIALSRAGFEVKPVILSTRSNGLIFDWKKTKTDFNHVVALVTIDGKELVLDATTSMGGIGTLPLECLNGQGLIVDKKRNAWKNLRPSNLSRKVNLVELRIDNDVLKGIVKTNYTDYYAMTYKDLNPNLDADKLKESVESQLVAATVDSLSISVTPSNVPEIKLRYNFETTGAVASSGNIMYLSPFVGVGINSNPFKLLERKFPVNFGFPFEESYVIRLTLPEGYQVESMPQSISMSIPDGKGRFVFSASTLGNTIVLVGKVQINRDLFISDDYLVLKQFFEQIVSKSNEKIVLKKV